MIPYDVSNVYDPEHQEVPDYGSDSVVRSVLCMCVVLYFLKEKCSCLGVTDPLCHSA